MESAGIKSSFGYWCHFELLASWSCFVERTTMNKLVNGKFTAPACGLMKSGDREDDENDCHCYFVCVFRSVCARRMGSGVQSEKEGRKVEGAGN